MSVVLAIPTQLVFTDRLPDSVTAESDFGLIAELEVPFGNVATNYAGTVTAALASSPGNSTLGGTTRVDVSPTSDKPGYTVFTDLSLDKVGSTYTLKLTVDNGVDFTTADSTL